MLERSKEDLRGPLHDALGLKTLLAWSWVAVVGALSTAASVALLLAGALAWDRDRRLFHRIAAWWGATCLRLFPLRLELRGLENARGGPFIIAPNHQSMVDLLVTYLLPLPFRTVVKRSWFLSPFGLVIWAAGYVPTAKSADAGGAEEVIARCASWLDRGISILLFAEGKRSRSWKVGRFRRGPFELAVQTGTPILPVAIAGTNDVSHPSSLRFRFGTTWIVVDVLPPLSPEGATSQALRDRCRAVVTGRVVELRDELRREHRQGPCEGASAED